ncbi:helix-turn-helix domain-containing protein [Microbacterium sp.]|uniref:helix-turn-helix domain-containing protein n=1 Tax=Microbacterium sp. TaxID=51671 RepID=UPI0031FF2CDC|nr:helix-turn-helix domain-containing protein [Microbacterium sp.]
MELSKAFYSPAEVAKMIDVHPTTILNYIRDEKLYAIRLSERTIRIPARSVLKLLAPDEIDEPRLIERPHDDVSNAVKSTGHNKSDELVPA